MTTRPKHRTFPAPPKRSLQPNEPMRFKAMTPELVVEEADDDVMGDKVAQEVRFIIFHFW